MFKSKIVSQIAAIIGLLGRKGSESNPKNDQGLPEVDHRDINVGDMILMEYSRGLVETVVVEAVIDGIVYGLGDDGEPFCAPIADCDKVPY
jgi:hypothetical protein